MHNVIEAILWNIQRYFWTDRDADISSLTSPGPITIAAQRYICVEESTDLSTANTDLRPFLRQHVKQFVLDITLNHNLVISGYRAAASKTTSEKLAGDLQVNFFDKHTANTLNVLPHTVNDI